MATRTEYQKTHYPVSKVENKCDGKRNSDNFCKKCGRGILRNGEHKPNRDGYLGWTLTWADGSVVDTFQEEAMAKASKQSKSDHKHHQIKEILSGSPYLPESAVYKAAFASLDKLSVIAIGQIWVIVCNKRVE